MIRRPMVTYYHKVENFRFSVFLFIQKNGENNLSETASVPM